MRTNSLGTINLLPRTFTEQSEKMPDKSQEYRDTLARKLHDDVKQTFESCQTVIAGAGPFSILASDYRGKSDESIKRKLSRKARKINQPIYDLYGCRFALPEGWIYPAIDIVSSRWPTPPVLYPGTSTLRIYRKGLNIPRISHPEYEGVHMLILFDLNGRKEVGEIQLYTPQQWQKEQETRDYYHQ